MKNPLTTACCVKYPACRCDTIAAKVARKMNDLRLQEIAHDKGEACEEDDCQDCCGEFCGHEFEDYTCLNCGAETDGSSEIDAAQAAMEDR